MGMGTRGAGVPTDLANSAHGYGHTRGNGKHYGTRSSQVIPQPSTNRAQPRLTSEFRWDRVLSWWYDRSMLTKGVNATNALILFPAKGGLLYKILSKDEKIWNHFSICACHPCAGAMLIFSVSFQF